MSFPLIYSLQVLQLHLNPRFPHSLQWYLSPPDSRIPLSKRRILLPYLQLSLPWCLSLLPDSRLLLHPSQPLLPESRLPLPHYRLLPEPRLPLPHYRLLPEPRLLQPERQHPLPHLLLLLQMRSLLPNLLHPALQPRRILPGSPLPLLQCRIPLTYHLSLPAQYKCYIPHSQHHMILHHLRTLSPRPLRP